MQFSYQPSSVKVVFGKKIKEAITEELKETGPKNFIIFSTPRYASLVEELKTIDGFNCSLFFDKQVQHVPQPLVNEAKEKIKGLPADILLSIGGGSAVGLAKAIALENHLPIWAVPTTYAGSEMTNVYGITSAGEKLVGKSSWVLPQKAVYDPSLSASMPVRLAATSAVNALAHVAEALYSPNSNPITYQVALLAISHLTKGMKIIAETGKLTNEANSSLQLGACLSGKALCEVLMALHHKVAHVLGGSFGMDHAKVHTVLLPYILAYQWEHLEKPIQEDFIKAFESDYPPKKLKDLIEGMRVDSNLQQIGFHETDIEKAATLISKIDFKNPAPVNYEKIVDILKNAYNGKLL